MKFLKETKTYFLSFVIFVIFKFVNCSAGHEEPSKEHHLSANALKSYLTQLMSKNALAWTCPAPKFPVADEDCTAPTCKEEETCSSEEDTCCFNGCVFTCVKKLAPPPIIDWEVKPVPEDPDEEGDDSGVRYCSISPLPAPSKPVGCPDGFSCQVKAAGFRGICVPIDTESHIVHVDTHLREHKAKETVYLPGGCILSQAQYNEMKEFEKRPYVIDCFCMDGSVECQLDPSEKYQDKTEKSTSNFENENKTRT